uniref:Potassium channel domain-containing protein n=1 Tax=Anopheles maculatus TaxID=74869 RepID=A0A182SZK2_9DIPT
MKRQNIRTLSLVVCTFTYLLIGAAVFDALESETEARRWEFLKSKCAVRPTEQPLPLPPSLYPTAGDDNNGIKCCFFCFLPKGVKANFVAKYNITPEDYHMIEIVITENKPHKAGPQWKFAGAFYFATVVLAMIGYGHSTPVTIGGKAFCMAYAMVGIPLGLVMFQSIGERLNKFASVVIRRAKKYLRCQQTEATEMNLMLATGLLSSVIITTGAAVFSRYEGWSYFDSFYYCFVTLTTIGFGDYVALQNDQALINKPGYVALSLVFILFGLAVVAASINLLVLRFMTMNAEDIRREEAEMQSSVDGLTTYECESTGKLLSCANLNYCSEIEEEDTSVCSCTCLGGNSFTTHEH